MTIIIIIIIPPNMSDKFLWVAGGGTTQPDRQIPGRRRDALYAAS